MTTHIGDLGVGTLGVAGERIAELLIHTCPLLAAPHTLVLWIGVLTKTTVIPLNGTVVQCDCRENSEETISIILIFFFLNIVLLHIQRAYSASSMKN